jgi:hypothetical protein
MGILRDVAAKFDELAGRAESYLHPAAAPGGYQSPGNGGGGNGGNGGGSVSQQILPLDTFATVALDVNGNGVASLGPGLPRQHWQPGSAFVGVGTNVSEAACILYLGTTIGTGTQLAQTSKGSTGATAGLSGDMASGYRIWAQWTGGDAGSTATLRVTGSQSIGAVTS